MNVILKEGIIMYRKLLKLFNKFNDDVGEILGKLSRIDYDVLELIISGEITIKEISIKLKIRYLDSFKSVNLLISEGYVYLESDVLEQCLQSCRCMYIGKKKYLELSDKLALVAGKTFHNIVHMMGFQEKV